MGSSGRRKTGGRTDGCARPGAVTPGPDGRREPARTWRSVPPPKPLPASGTYVTPAQAAVYASFMRTHSESETARELSMSQISVREALVQYERNLLRDAGVQPPTLKEMLRGDVSTRFDISRDLRNGRPASHPRAVAIAIPAAPAGPRPATPAGQRRINAPASGVRRVVVTAVHPDSPVHSGFMRNLEAYAAHHGADLMTVGLGSRAGGTFGTTHAPIDFGGRLDLRADVSPPLFAKLPLEGLQHLSPGRWSAFPHSTVQLESLPRLGALPPRIQMTTGAATIHADRARHMPTQVGALVVEMLPDGRVFARTVSAAADGDGTFHDLDERVHDGRVWTGQRVAGLVLGDIHHPLTDPDAAAATWGTSSAPGLVARLRPRVQVMHDVCDMRARSHHQRRDQHARFEQHARGTGDVRAELAATVAFLEGARIPGGTIAVVHSNHDDFLLRWLREADHRADPLNAEFYLDRERAIHARLRAGTPTSTFFAETMRGLSRDSLADVRFLVDGESLEIGGIECGIHGHAGPDGCRGSIGSFERLGMNLVLGHFHQPSVRGGVHVAGVCQTRLGYNRGPSTWAVAHVVCHDDGARQHVFLDGDRFAA